MSKKEIYVMLLDIRSVYNVGAIFRTADALGIDKIFLAGITPTPLDRFGRERKDLAKSALGAEKSVPWGQVENAGSLIRKMKKEGVEVIAIEQSENSVDYKKIKIKNPTMFIVGNEVEGIPAKILKECDEVAEIPMKGKKESLNVAVSFAVALFRILNV